MENESNVGGKWKIYSRNNRVQNGVRSVHSSAVNKAYNLSSDAVAYTPTLQQDKQDKLSQCFTKERNNSITQTGADLPLS